jgi:hypothetical protein
MEQRQKPRPFVFCREVLPARVSDMSNGRSRTHTHGGNSADLAGVGTSEEQGWVGGVGLGKPGR